uniref:Protein translocase subunit SecA n=1 Tax=Schizocladia ischiensis TaxID=196139 RepID=A0A7S6ZP86_9STRA|nr:SecA [Schizocladia ischiensis]QOW07474.1 SecA [Schizocladia ischiensis]
MVQLFFQENRLWNKYKSFINSINDLEIECQNLSNFELKERIVKLKRKGTKTKIITDETIINGFAVTREASKRTIGLKHYDVQILGGLVLNDGNIAEMKTGEGKTLVSTAPALVNALTGKGVHIVTVNDYLATRDAEWMGRIHRFLGLKVGLITGSMQPQTRKKNYERDITYVTNGELVFDFLKDNMVTTLEDLVQRPFNYCIVDEVDDILIDEARTPLMISQESEVNISKFFGANEVANFLENIKHFTIDEKAKQISLTNLGIERTKFLLNVNDLYDITDPWIPYILNALKAKCLFLNDIHYIIKNNQVIIVDEFTGRIMEGRKWGDGLHEAIEAKENIKTIKGSNTLASITFQSFFRLYPKISGMTGTAKTEELEFEKIYDLSVSVIPTAKPMQRQDKPDLIFLDDFSKWKAVARECEKMYRIGRPVLVGTTTIQKSQVLSQLLVILNVPHELLNAKPRNAKREATIIAQAGCLKSITIATNMAGRGTDIILGGNPEFKSRSRTYSILEVLVEKNNNNIIIDNVNLQPLQNALRENFEFVEHLKKNLDILLTSIQSSTINLNPFEKLIHNLYIELYQKFKQEQEYQSNQVKKLGGLYVIGTERHESRRIDNQLRGRAGRQGNPGTSCFFLSLTDPLVKIFGGDTVTSIIKNLPKTDEPLDSALLSRTLDSAQQKVEGFYYDQRKTLDKYDQLINKQRSVVYTLRETILKLDNDIDIMSDFIIEFGEALIDDLIGYLKVIKNKKIMTNYNTLSMNRINKLLNRMNITTDIIYRNIEDLESLRIFLYQQLWSCYNRQKDEFAHYDDNILYQYERLIFLRYIDMYWPKHLENVSSLKESVMWQGYAQKDPFVIYEMEAEDILTLTLKECRDALLYEVFISYIV